MGPGFAACLEILAQVFVPLGYFLLGPVSTDQARELGLPDGVEHTRPNSVGQMGMP
jgi:hypothetical protein